MDEIQVKMRCKFFMILRNVIYISVSYSLLSFSLNFSFAQHLPVKSMIDRIFQDYGQSNGIRKVISLSLINHKLHFFVQLSNQLPYRIDGRAHDFKQFLAFLDANSAPRSNSTILDFVKDVNGNFTNTSTLYKSELENEYKHIPLDEKFGFSEAEIYCLNYFFAITHEKFILQIRQTNSDLSDRVGSYETLLSYGAGNESFISTITEKSFKTIMLKAIEIAAQHQYDSLQKRILTSDQIFHSIESNPPNLMNMYD